MAQELTQQVYDPDQFQSFAALVVDHITEHLRQAYTNPCGKIATGSQLDEICETFFKPAFAKKDLAQKVKDLIASYTNNSLNLHSPYYMGHQVPPPAPLAGIFQGLALTLNQGLAVAEMSPFASSIERTLIKKLLKKVGYDQNAAAGIITSGGSLANLTALLSARAKAQPDSWTRGTQAEKYVICSERAHYSVSRACGIIGIGEKSCIKVPGILTKEKLEEVFRSIEPKKILAVIASAPSTPFGEIDDLLGLGECCESKNIWLHVDGVHGASLLFSPKYSHLLQGIERATSISWDAHKMLHVPSLCTFLLYKDKQHAATTFRQDASYLFDDDNNWYAHNAKMTFECTKPSLATGLWAVWAVYGDEFFRECIEKCMSLTEQAYEFFSTHPDFKCPGKPATNILCFRVEPQNQGATDLDALQIFLRKKLIEQGQFYITSTNSDGKEFLRLTLINPLTTIEHVKALANSLLQLLPR